MFVSRLASIGVALALLAAFALGAARPSAGAAPETRYVVQPGDTLWTIAETRYEDPREGIWRIQDANGLTGGTLKPGQVIRVPG
jgi:nucleoid-associated protein YgaU